jgi:hypothetical protein
MSHSYVRLNFYKPSCLHVYPYQLQLLNDVNAIYEVFLLLLTFVHIEAYEEKMGK